MRLSTIAFLSVCTAAAVLTACGKNGFLGTAQAPSGTIVITQANSTTPIVTTPTVLGRYIVPGAKWSLAVGEKNFNGQFTATVIEGTNSPGCFVPHLVGPNVEPNIFDITADNAQGSVPTPVPSGSTATPSPALSQCDGTPQAPVNETLLFDDGRGHQAYFYYQLTTTIIGG